MRCQFCTKLVCQNCCLKPYKYPKSNNVGDCCRICEAKFLIKIEYDDLAKIHSKIEYEIGEKTKEIESLKDEKDELFA